MFSMKSVILFLTVALLLATTASAQVTVERVGGDLFVIGTNGADEVRISQPLGDVFVEGVYYRDVDAVWVATGNGDDAVVVISDGLAQFPPADISIDTGNGNDSVTHHTRLEFANAVVINTGNGDDYCELRTDMAMYGGGTLTIRTGNGKDVCELRSYYDVSLDVQLGTGTDTLLGHSYGSLGTIDGGNGKDSCADFEDETATLDIVNCEN